MPDIESLDAAALSMSRARAVLTLIAKSGDSADRQTILEATEVALEEVVKAAAALDDGTKKPGESPATITLRACGANAVVCQLSRAAS
ncbi:MAG: hypothetical protein VX796_09250 [Pseudomonadota bacterium]|nr:hypothetical protein [Pseudomonadota bacterium]